MGICWDMQVEIDQCLIRKKKRSMGEIAISEVLTDLGPGPDWSKIDYFYRTKWGYWKRK